MKFKLAVPLLMLLGCASSARYAYSELEACPAAMSEEQHQSGLVRCRAMCSSYARDVAEFDADCKCRCAPASGGGYRATPNQKGPPPYAGQQTMYTPAVR